MTPSRFWVFMSFFVSQGAVAAAAVYFGVERYVVIAYVALVSSIGTDDVLRRYGLSRAHAAIRRLHDRDPGGN